MTKRQIAILSIVGNLLIGCRSFKSLGKAESLGLSGDFSVNNTLNEVNDVEANVVLLFGQSNATGVSHNEYLKQNNPEIFTNYYAGFNNVLINFVCENFNNASRGFVTTKLGQAASVSHFGPEVGIAEVLSLSSQPSFIIKYSYGGTTLNNQWLDSQRGRGELYNASLDFTKNSLDYLISKGYKLNILGLCWMQGENDASKLSTFYYKDTKALVGFYRSDLASYCEKLKFVDACINNKHWGPFAKRINEDKLKFSKDSKSNILIDTNELGLTTDYEPFDSPDIAHYDSLSMVELGRAFGKNLI